MKTCNSCGEDKPYSEFYPRKNRANGYHHRCKPCSKKHVTSRRQRIKQTCVDYKGGKCERCGYDKCLAAFDFHHIDPNQKDYALARKISDCSNPQELFPELDKCMLLCANCHREEHAIVNSAEPILPKQPKPDNHCVDCNVVITNQAGVERCLPCHHKARERIDWPSDVELKQLVWQYPRAQLAKQFNVSDVAIAKRCKRRGIEMPGRGYWSGRLAN